jgi:hypothetical protein
VSEVAQTTVETEAHAVPAGCANCGRALDGPYCPACGQKAVDFHRPLRELVSQAVEETLSVDARLVRTLRPILFKPGLVTREYLSGHRVVHVPPLKTYLISALVFFGLFAAFPTRAQISVFTTGEERPTGGTRMTFELPAHLAINDGKYQELVTRAKANPERFASAVGSAVPAPFFSSSRSSPACSSCSTVARATTSTTWCSRSITTRSSSWCSPRCFS